VLFTALMPIVMLLTITYVGAVNPRLEEAGRLVSRWPNVLRRITLPLIAPAILFAAILVFLLAFGEVGVPTYLRYPVYPVEILAQFAAFYDFGAATAAAIPMLLVTLAILTLEYRLLHNPILELKAVRQGARRTQITLGHWRLPVFGIVLGWALLTVVLPLAVLVIQRRRQRVALDFVAAILTQEVQRILGGGAVTRGDAEAKLPQCGFGAAGERPGVGWRPMEHISQAKQSDGGDFGTFARSTKRCEKAPHPSEGVREQQVL